MRRFVLILSIWAILAAPAYAQGPQPLSLRDQLEQFMRPIVDFLNDYAVLAGCVGSICTGLNSDVSGWLGSNTFSTADTGQGPPESMTMATVPEDYYPDAPQAFRDLGYGMESLADRDSSQMSLLDFVRWLGVAFALPFQYIRAIWDFLREDVGPLALFVGWLFFAAWWVLIIYTISFVIKFVTVVIDIGQKLINVAALFKP
jgi:hypothetical protein